MQTNDLNLARAYYFIWIGAMGFLYPFVNMFYRAQGLSGSEIGLVIMFASCVGLIAAPMWGRLSDTGKSLTRLLQISFCITAILMLVRSQLDTFVWIALFAALQALGGAGIAPLSDALALRITEARRAGYGSVRLWGSAGWTLTVPFSGWLIERAGLSFAFVGNAIGFFVAALMLFVIKLAPVTHAQPVAKRAGLGDAVGALIRNAALLGLALAVIARGILNDGQQQFGNIYLEQLGASTAVIGFASMFGAVIEVPAMFAADRVVKRIGATRTLLLSFFISGAKFIFILLFPAIWSVLLARAIEGVGLSLYVIGLIKYIAEYSDSAHRATMLALFTVTLASLISMIGALFGGIMFDAVGAYWLYAFAMFGNFCAGAILFGFALRRVTKATAPTQSPSPSS